MAVDTDTNMIVRNRLAFVINARQKWQSLWSHNYITGKNRHIKETDTFNRLL
jgi:hypothetical protein